MEEKKVDRRVRKTKKQLRLALTTLLKEKPIQDIKVREIADMIDINRGTFYQHYRDVYDMLYKIEDDMLDQFNQILNSADVEIMSEKPFEVLSEVFRFLKENVDMASVLMGPNGDQVFLDKVRNVIKEKCIHDWMQTYKNAADKNFEYYYSYVVSGLVGLVQVWLETGTEESPDDMAALAEQMVLKGVKVLK